MAISKLILDGVVQMDDTDNTITASTVLYGYTGEGADGETVTGNVTFVTYRTGSSAPSSSLGVDGDIYLQTGS